MVADMRVQVLVSAVNEDNRQLAARMNLQTEAVVINQCGRIGYEEFSHNNHKIACYSFAERGVGLSRNNALMRADGDICLFSDEDIVLKNGYGDRIEEEFRKHPEADLLTFNVDVHEKRATYCNTSFKRVRWYNYGRYPAYSIAARTEVLHKKRVCFSTLFGGGARYSNGEDSLFLRDCLKRGIKIYAVNVSIGKETYRESTWFKGYNEKFFFDRGVLYHSLYGRMALPFSLRFLLAHRKVMCSDISFGKAYHLMKDGIRTGKGKVIRKWTKQGDD